jgi:hypothetical protein
VRIGGTDKSGTKTLTTIVPGLGESVDRYRQLLSWKP